MRVTCVCVILTLFSFSSLLLLSPDMDSRRIGIVGAKPGVPYSEPSSDSPLRTFGWQWVIISIAIVIGIILLCMCCVRARQHQSQPAQAPYLLHQPPPSVIQSAPYAPQQAQMASRGAHQYPGQPMTMESQAPPPAARSSFTRDFYAQQP